MSACCSPTSGGVVRAQLAVAPSVHPPPARKASLRGMVLVAGGPFQMGGTDADGNQEDGEGPVRRVDVPPFYVDVTTVTNAQFAAFIKATGYVTEAERFGWSYVFYRFVGPAARGHVLDGVVQKAPWWVAVSGATWRAPEGPGSSMGMRQNHPVVHVSWQDASAYAAWAGKRLPSEAEWEKAARGGLPGARFPWGDELAPKGRHRCNIWQGRFPQVDTGEDGYVGTAPARAFAPNEYGLYNTSGNVWEWCADWWSTTWHAEARLETRQNPHGPPRGDGKVVRGGSYLCHASYCNRFRLAARTWNTPDSSTGHMGFRCVADAV